MSFYRVKKYGLEQGALEIQYIEEFFSLKVIRGTVDSALFFSE